MQKVINKSELAANFFFHLISAIPKEYANRSGCDHQYSTADHRKPFENPTKHVQRNFLERITNNTALDEGYIHGWGCIICNAFQKVSMNEASESLLTKNPSQTIVSFEPGSSEVGRILMPSH